MANMPPWISKIDFGYSSHLVGQDSLLVDHFCISDRLLESIKFKLASSLTIHSSEISLASLP
jgi:hypothetical protein